MDTQRPGLSWMPEAYVIERAGRGTPLADVDQVGLLAVVRTADALTVISMAGRADVPRWRCFRVDGPIEHHVTGILAGISQTLSERGIPIFAVSEFDTDYVLVPEDQAAAASTALSEAGHPIHVHPE